MRKLVVIALIASLALPEFVQAAPMHSVNSVQIEASRKRPYRKKKGFMWGIFKKKNKGCGCPSYK
ncbi:MAG: hypothetical protein QM669_01445 [Siphonobacter sp.]